LTQITTGYADNQRRQSQAFAGEVSKKRLLLQCCLALTLGYCYGYRVLDYWL